MANITLQSGAVIDDKGKVVTPVSNASIQPSSAITLPTPPPDTTNYNANIAGGQATIDANNKGFMTAPVTPPSATDQYVSSLKDLGSAPSTASQYATDYANSGIDANQQAVIAQQQALNTAQSKLSGINARLAGVTAAGKVAELKASEMGNTLGFAAGETSRVQKQAAIQALPIQAEALGAQAEVQAAQGNVQLAQETLKLAQDRLNTVFDMHTKDAQNRYNAQKDLISAVYTQASAKEKTLLDAKQKQEDQNFQMMRDSINNAQAIAKTAMDNGQASLASQITSLDPKSPDYVQKLAGLQRQIQPKGTGADTNKLLSVSEAQALGVPYGTTQAEAIIMGKKTKIDANTITDPNLPAEQKNATAIEALAANPKISSTMRTQLKYALGVITSAQDLASANQNGNFTGVNPFNTVLNAQIPFTDIGIVPFRKTLQSAGGIKNEQYINGIKLAVGYWASGATLTAQQLKLVDGMTPIMTDSDANVRTKLNSLTNFMLGQTKSALQSEGIHFQPVEVNLFETKDMIDKLSPAQKAELDKQGLLPDWAK